MIRCLVVVEETPAPILNDIQPAGPKLLERCAKADLGLVVKVRSVIDDKVKPTTEIMLNNLS
ncbi:hypothetical protein D3C87_1845330 [compost metagenome]